MGIEARQAQLAREPQSANVDVNSHSQMAAGAVFLGKTYTNTSYASRTFSPCCDDSCPAVCKTHAVESHSRSLGGNKLTRCRGPGATWYLATKSLRNIYDVCYSNHRLGSLLDTWVQRDLGVATVRENNFPAIDVFHAPQASLAASNS